MLISRITWVEMLIGAQDNGAELRDFLETQFEIIALDLAVAQRAVELRRTHHIRLPDAIIWASQVHDAVLVTRNTKDFRADWEGIRVPYEL